MTTPAPAPTPESTPAEPDNQPGTPPAPTDPAPTPPAPAAPATPEPAEPKPADEPRGKTPKFEGELDPAKIARLVENLRGDVEAEKQKRQAAEKKAADEQATFMKKVAAAFGVETDEKKPPTPEELAKQLEEERNRTKESDDRTRQTQVEFALYKAAGPLGADPALVTAVLAHSGQLASLDPTSSTFKADVEKAVKTAVDTNPRLAAKAPEPKEPEPTPAGGAPMDGAPGGKRQLGAADAARMSPEEIAQAVEEGRFKSYLGG